MISETESQIYKSPNRSSTWTVTLVTNETITNKVQGLQIFTRGEMKWWDDKTDTW